MGIQVNENFSSCRHGCDWNWTYVILCLAKSACRINSRRISEQIPPCPPGPHHCFPVLSGQLLCAQWGHLVISEISQGRKARSCHPTHCARQRLQLSHISPPENGSLGRRSFATRMENQTFARSGMVNSSPGA